MKKAFKSVQDTCTFCFECVKIPTSKSQIKDYVRISCK